MSDNGLCATALLAIFAVATFLVSLPRTLGRLSWLALFSVVCITICGFLAMIGAGVNPAPDRVIVAAVPADFYQAFLAITGPVRPAHASVHPADFRNHARCSRTQVGPIDSQPRKFS